MENNSFKKIEEEELENVSFPEEEILQEVEAEMSGFHFIGGTFSTFFSRLFEVIVGLLGGKLDDRK